jgi:hypothetical protein
MSDLRIVNPMAGQPAANGADMVSRVRAVLSTLELDCACRAKIDGALERFAGLEQQRERRRLIAEGREQVARIGGLLDFLHELDGLMASETDLSVFAEIACLFDDVAEAARAGARAMRAASPTR